MNKDSKTPPECTGEVVETPPQTRLEADAARVLTNRIKESAEDLWRMLLEAYEGGAHTALGYASWGAYFEAEFGGSRRRGYELLDAGRVCQAIEETGAEFRTEQKPNAGQAVELAPLTKENPKQAAKVWHEVVAKHSGTQTAADVRQAVAEMGRERHLSGVHFSSSSAEWYTPSHILDRAVQALGGIDLDPCADPERRVPAVEHFTETEDGLSRPWRGRVFLNPPYGRETVHWIGKLKEEYDASRVSAAVVLVAARTDTAWFGILRQYPRCFLRKRLHFSEHSNGAAFPSVVIFVNKDIGAFAKAFGDLGDIYEHHETRLPAVEVLDLKEAS